MFITDAEINVVRDRTVDPKIQTIIGAKMYYAFLYSNDTAVQTVPARLLNVREGEDGIAGPFYASIAIATAIEGYYVVLNDILSYYLSFQFVDDDTDAGDSICAYVEFDKILKIIDQDIGITLGQNNNKTHLKLVIDNKNEDNHEC